MSTASKRASARKTYRTEWVDRWSPPKPLVGLQAIEKVLNRHTFLVTPESRLVVAVLARAIHDSLSLTNRRMRREARRFLLGEDLTLWCDLVGLHPDFVRFVARRTGRRCRSRCRSCRYRMSRWSAPAARPCIPSPATPTTIRHRED
ncbi:conserved protein of unknown function [Denitratisoma oestradiolicum]|uniref:Uncharacterized protein n=1 Tax=Denitratisoma oestradiolicum TaxID=311182 RepID=A0A6S6XST0_9PROT|nr:hypothetical protein [Denitratisoma oestradiolicum]CAB1367203.1 conserved protein of unknown function [Denitratisoma oestradiolicum]